MKGKIIVPVLVLVGALNAFSARCEAHPADGKAPAPEQATVRQDAKGGPKYFTDIELLDQNGSTKRFYSDLLQGKVVVINSFFTECTNVCPVLMKQFTDIQNAVGGRLGSAVHLLSLSLDPAHDTPPRVKEYAKRFSAKPGWYFLTGKKQNVDFALRKLGQYVEQKEDHYNLFIIGNEKTGLWKKAFGLAKSEKLIEIVEGVLNDR